MSEYLADTEEIRHEYAQALAQTTFYTHEEWVGKFDRWLAEYTRQQREEAYDEGVEVGRFYAEDMTFAPLSPYRYRKETP